MNAGMVSTIAAYIVMQILDPEGVLSVDVQIAISAVAFIASMWVKTKLDEMREEERPSKTLETIV